ncbi:hypothetical protein ACVIWU_006652 [Bradyrhizobium sp. USDA 4509]
MAAATELRKLDMQTNDRALAGGLAPSFTSSKPPLAGEPGPI